MITTIIFDYGGVFSLRESLPEFSRYYAKKNNIDQSAIDNVMIRNWDKAKIGSIDSNIFFEELSELAKRDIHDFKIEFVEYFGFNDKLFDYVKKELYGEFKLGILSNQIEAWLGPILEEKILRNILIKLLRPIMKD